MILTVISLEGIILPMFQYPVKSYLFRKIFPKPPNQNSLLPSNTTTALCLYLYNCIKQPALDQLLIKYRSFSTKK